MVQWSLHLPDGHDGPTEISSWVVGGRLAMGYYPGMLRHGEVAPTVLDELLDCGIDQFVNLTQDWPGGTDKHLTHYYRLPEGSDGSPLVRAGRREGKPVNVAFHPVPDEHLPGCNLRGSSAAWSSCDIDGYGENLVSCEDGRPVPATRLILDALDGFLEQGRNVYVHCWGGSGRTGTIIGCWIRRHDLVGADEVLESLRDLREGDSVKNGKPIPQTPAHVDMVLSWEPGW